MFVVICNNTEGEPDIYYGWETQDEVQEWIDFLEPEDCPNEHYWIEAIKQN